MSADSIANAPPHPSFAQALRFWLKLGLISFGGPAGQIAIMHQELVEHRRWISERRFLHALNYCMVLPGPEAQQLATYIGWLLHGTRGGIAAGALFVLPSLLLLIVLSYVYMAYGDQALIAAVFAGIKPAVAVIVLQAAHRIGGRSLRNPVMWSIAIAAFVAIFALHLPFPLILASAAVIGAIGGRIKPEYFQQAGHGGSSVKQYGAALIDDHTVLADSTKFRWGYLASVLVLGVFLWCVPMALLYLTFGWQHQLTQMAWFFTKAALLTFGGAYAVLPYVMQAAVEQFQWLSSRQMMDGLALGETTPGPLIMVLVFVGFVAAYGQHTLGFGHETHAGVLAACLVTWFTFLPSFIFIFAGAPLIETTHKQIRFTAPLSAITAAVVGVVLNLGVFFTWLTLFPQGLSLANEWSSIYEGLDKSALAIAAVAALALFYWKRKVMEVIAICAALGLVLHFLAR